MPARDQVPVGLAQQLRLKGIALEVQVQHAVVAHDQGEAPAVLLVPYHRGRAVIRQGVKGVILPGVGIGKAMIDQFPAVHRPLLSQVSYKGQPAHSGFLRQCALALMTMSAWNLLYSRASRGMRLSKKLFTA
ncbi:hypothetical protein SDC9_152522 [bioreactor metagenome]|uniref:Uncharacterized protein n=1 Tax=bioreactor metagenome TaxID=1076179 RepID=A0A645EVL5_9ZZZZ